jgi:hypothetical protein
MPDRLRPENVPPKPGTKPLEPSSEGNEEFRAAAGGLIRAGSTRRGRRSRDDREHQPDVAFVDVGGRKRASTRGAGGPDGDVKVKVGDKIRRDHPTAGGLKLLQARAGAPPPGSV